MHIQCKMNEHEHSATRDFYILCSAYQLGKFLPPLTLSEPFLDLPWTLILDKI